MFTFRFKSYRIFQYILILVFVSSEVIAGQTPKKCAAFNEYCLNHWDCCSNSCMSYMYRCTRGYNVYPYPFLGVSYKPTVTLDHILEQNFGSPNSLPSAQSKPYFISRFGGTDEAETTEVQIVLKNSEETATDANNSENTINKQENVNAILENNLADIFAGAENSNNKETFSTTEKAVSSNTTTEKPSCSEIGVKCYRNDECCSQRCHGFLHQCVT
ncbi:uncharacterized protein ACRADG_007112 [Cochliomyia hominivorax]